MKAVLEEVNKTTDYKKFELWEYNRQVSTSLVASLKKSILNQDFTKDNPITVIKDKKGQFVIADGQHRFIACRDLKLPIYYKVNNSYTVDQLVTENINHKKWGLSDVLRLKSKLGCSDSARLINDMDEFNVSAKIVTALSASIVSLKNHLTIRSDIFYTPENSLTFRSNYTKLKSLLKGVPMTAAISRGYMMLSNVEGFDYRHIKKQADTYGEKFIKKSMDTQTAFISLVKLYNYRCTTNKLTVVMEVE